MSLMNCFAPQTVEVSPESRKIVDYYVPMLKMNARMLLTQTHYRLHSVIVMVLM